MKKSIVNIESSTNSSFGTGFVIAKNSEGSYVLTCKHVIDDVIVPMIEEQEAKVIAKGDFIDMAILFVPKLYLDVLPLKFEKTHNLEVNVIGFSAFNQASVQKKHIEATLYKENIELHSKHDDSFYNLRKIKAKDGFSFERGNSGSPVICKASNHVIAMISNKEGNSLAYAINIESLKNVWSDMPKALLQSEVNYIKKPSQNIKKNSFDFKKYLLPLLGGITLVGGLSYWFSTVSSSSMLTPSSKNCLENGGEFIKNGMCRANWIDAEMICKVTNSKLPSIESLSKIANDCGGLNYLGNFGKNEQNSDYQTCYKKQGFTSDTHWSANTHPEEHAYAIFFDFNNAQIGEDDKERYKHVVRCVNAD